MKWIVLAVMLLGACAMQNGDITLKLLPYKKGAKINLTINF